jgi:chromosome segregation ATPase
MKNYRKAMENYKMSFDKEMQAQHDIIATRDERIKVLETELEESNEARGHLKYDIEELNEKIITFEEELFESKTIQLDLLDQLKLCEDKLGLAEEKIYELLNLNEELEKTQAVYIAHKNDHVDQTLGNYLNRFPEKKSMNIMFLRESEGVYQFGQKRVYVKIEKGNQILCRVGGGYMHIDEFI